MESGIENWNRNRKKCKTDIKDWNLNQKNMVYANDGITKK